MQSLPGQSLWRRLFIYVGAAVILMIFALYNGYPIICGDTAAYINSGFNLEVPVDRPVFYGLFLRAASLGSSLWIAAFVQCLLLSYALVRFIRGLLPEVPVRHVLGLVVLVALGTLSGWYVGQIMPDAFTAILFFAAAAYLLYAESSRQKVLLLVVVLVSILMHYSHYMIGSLFTLVVLLMSFAHKNYRQYRRRAGWLMGICMLAWLSLYTSNYIGGRGFVSSRSSHVFLMAKLTESGILKNYLDKTCPVKDYRICAYKDSLPNVAWGFVWDANSPVNKTGGWEANRREYNHILADIVSQPKYWPYLAFKSMEATGRQLAQPNIDEGEERAWAKYGKDDAIYWCINQWFGHESNEFLVTKQNQKQMDLPFFDHLYTCILVLSSLVCLFGMNSMDARMKALYLLVFAFLLLNAFVTATFANVLGRLNSRAIWILPAVNFVVIYRMVADWIERRSKRRAAVYN